MCRLLMVILFWPVIVWFYSVVIALMAVVIILTADVIQKILPFLAMTLVAFCISYLLFKLHFWGRHKTTNNFKRNEQDLNKAFKHKAVEKFIPSTNLYCYWCTRKLGIKAWERAGHYYCDECYKKGTK